MSLTKKAIGGSIHRIREFELEKVNLIDEFDILQIVGEGWFGKILLTEHRSTQTEMVLKALPKAYTGISDFFREFHYGLHLAAHRNIITTYDVAFETAGFYVFSQEYAPLGDLTSNVTETGLGELHAKRVARQLAAAVHHIHSRELVHRDIKLDNVLVFRSDFSRIKLCDFGETRRVNTVVRRHNEWLPYSPPEVLQIDTDVTYKALTSHDVWQFGIVLFVCLTGCLPWQKAALDDPRYTRYQNWHNATLNIAKKPKLFQLISSRAQRMFKRLLDPKAEKRPVSVLEVNKYLEDRWLAKLGAEKALNGGADERDELCPSMYSFHSSLEEKNQLLHTLTTYGIETTVDRSKKKDRIRQWIQSSAIMEEYEEEEEEEGESDINEDPRYYEDEDEEPTSMKGRHFPEARPTAKTNDVKKRSRTNTSSARKRQSIKPAERKIPFAPQVAEERETIARFASFPNGDPNLAISRNGTNGTLDSRSAPNSAVLAANSESAVEDASANGKAGSNDSPTSGANDSRNNADPASSAVFNELSSSADPEGKVRASITDAQDGKIARRDVGNDRSSPKSPQIPARKHRSQTAPFPVPTSPELNGSATKPTQRSQSATALPTIPRERSVLSAARADKSPVVVLPTRADSQSSTNPSMAARTERSPVAATTAPVVARAENRSASTAAIARTERLPAPTQSMSRVENQSSVMLPVARVENQLSNTLPITRNEKSPPGAIQLPPANPLTMSVASHLVMQSFNALQGMNTPQSAPSTSETLDPSTGSASNLQSTPKSSPSTTPARTSTPKNSPTSTPVRTLTPKASPTSTPSRTILPTSTPRVKASPRAEEIVTYGKDAYEHYGIAQGAIFRAGVVRNGSTGSGSRSVSN